MLVIVPGPETLDLRIFAKGAHAKKVKMATHEQAEAMTGLQTGGISALALINKGFEAVSYTHLDVYKRQSACRA